MELIIAKFGMDPLKSKYKMTLGNEDLVCEIETEEIELYNILDWSQFEKEGKVTRTGSFIIEDGAEITLVPGQDKFKTFSTGKEMIAKQKLDSILNEQFSLREEEIKNIEDKGIALRMRDRLAIERQERTLLYS